MKKEIFSCDICKKEGEIKKIEMDVLFTTDQTEGRYCETHLSRECVELCYSCKQKVLEGNYVWGSGCQGHNTYWFKEPTK